MDKFPPSGRFWDRTKKLLLTALPDSGGERKGSALLLGHLLATNCSAWVTWRPLTTCGHHLCTPPPQGRDPARAGPWAGPRAVPPLSERRLCPATSGKLPQGRLVAAQREDRPCLLAPTEQKPQGLSQGPPAPPPPVGSWPIACLLGNSVLPPLQTDASTRFLQALPLRSVTPKIKPKLLEVACVLCSLVLPLTRHTVALLSS